MEFSPGLHRNSAQLVMYYIWDGAPDSSRDYRSNSFVYLFNHLPLLFGHVTEGDIATFQNWSNKVLLIITSVTI